MSRIESLAPTREVRTIHRFHEGEDFDRGSADCLAGIVRHSFTSPTRFSPDIAIALPCGNSPIGMYREFIEIYRSDPSLDLSHVTVVGLSELRVPPSHPESFYNYFQRNLIGPINEIDPERGIKPGNVIMFDGAAADTEAECQRVGDEIKQRGGVEVTFLGLGRNAHIAFNEPGSAIDSQTRFVDLSPETASAFGVALEDGSLCQQAFTLGIAIILASSEIVLMVKGNKEEAYRRMWAMSTRGEYCPAAFLKDFRRELVVILENGIR